MSWDEKAQKFRFQRGQGISEEAKEELTAFNNAQKDWTGRCRVCGEVLTGSLRELVEHKHGPKGS